MLQETKLSFVVLTPHFPEKRYLRNVHHHLRSVSFRLYLVEKMKEKNITGKLSKTFSSTSSLFRFFSHLQPGGKASRLTFLL